MKKYTVTVGIVAHNEELNIENILISIMRQKKTDYILEKVLVLCDGCTDSTYEIAKIYADKNPIIQVVSNKKRIGKKYRLQELFVKNTSDIVISFDADTILCTVETINKIVKRFDENKIVYVCSNGHAIKPRNFFESLLNLWDDLWNDIASNTSEGDNILNVRSYGFALRGWFAKDILFPKKILAEAKFIYFFVKVKKMKFRFADKAIVCYRAPSNFHDYMLRKETSVNQPKLLARYFGDWIYKDYKVFKNRIKLFFIMKYLFRLPIQTISAIFLQLYVSFIHINKNHTDSSEFFVQAKSTKEPIIIIK